MLSTCLESFNKYEIVVCKLLQFRRILNLSFGKGLICINVKLHKMYFNHLPYVKILTLSELKAFADDKINAAQMMISVFDRVENIVGKGIMLVTSIFSFSHNVFYFLLFHLQRQKVISLKSPPKN